MRRNSKILPTRPSKRSSYRRTSTKQSDASTLYLDWAEAAEYASKNRPVTSSSASAGDRSVCSAPKSTKIASSFLSLNLFQETEHVASATSSCRSFGGMMKRNPSNRSRQRNSTATTSSRVLKKDGSSGMLLSDLASEISSLCSASQFEEVNNDDGDGNVNGNCDDDDNKSITFDDLIGSDNNTPALDVDDNCGSSSSSRRLFHKFVDHVKTVASNSTSNLGSMSELSEGLAAEVAPSSGHRSAYFNNRISIRVRRASDLLFSSHRGKIQDLEDLLEEEQLEK